jgi:hypothetical protein
MKRWGPGVTVIVSLLLLSLGSVILTQIFPLKEMFGAQGGEMVQLASSHVPTAEDEEDWKKEAAQIRRDLINMTGAP